MASDTGSQIVTIRFHQAVDSDIVNRRFLDVRALGIYKGGRMSWDGSSVTLSPLVCEICGATDGVYYQVRVETTADVTQALANGQYLVLRWVYTGVEDSDFMEIVSTNSLDTDDIVVGRVVAGVVTYAERTTPDTHHLFLRVEERETPSSSVRIRAGVGHAGSAHNKIIDRIIDLSEYASGNVIYIYVDDSGGVDHSTTAADYVGKALLAKIIYPADEIIENSDIEDARSFLTPLHKTNHYLSTYNIAVQQVANGVFTKADLGTIKNQKGITVSSNQITLAAGRKYALSYGVQFAPAPTSDDGDPSCAVKWVVSSGDTTWDLEEISLDSAECEGGVNNVITHLSRTCYIIPSSETVIELQIFTENTTEKAQAGNVITNIMSMD